MKKIFTLLFFIIAHFSSYGQCSTVAVQISSSDTTFIQLYQAGFFLIPSGFDNIVEWEATTFSGEVLHQDTTSGSANDQSTSPFNHSVPITDSIKVSILITNNTEGITCTMSDTLFWKETEVLPGSFIGNWEVLSSNGGEEEPISTSNKEILENLNVEIFPMPANDHFEIRGDLDGYSISIFDINGQVLDTYYNLYSQAKVDISKYSSGMYFVQFWDKNRNSIGIKKMVKL